MFQPSPNWSAEERIRVLRELYVRAHKSRLRGFEDVEIASVYQVIQKVVQATSQQLEIEREKITGKLAPLFEEDA